MEDSKKQVIDVIKQATNILVTVRNSPSIDQLSACIALTLSINELGKHGTAVFSGSVPSVLEFLEPEKTIERNTDSLQDFIISLDKSKADKLRYKVEDTVVKIFITPYRTSITDKDLEFGQGDFNVDAVIALGVHNQDDLDQAITAHGRILHDATVVSINTVGGVDEALGSINWVDADASSLSEMIAGLAPDLGKEDVIDNQIATALLTGIVAETERFGNAKTTPHTMEVSARLLTAGANQELVATKLSEPERNQPVEMLGADDGLIDGVGGNAADQGSKDGSDNDNNGDGGSPGDPGMLEIDHNGSDDGPHDGGGSENLQSAADALDVSQQSQAQDLADQFQEQPRHFQERLSEAQSSQASDEAGSKPGTVDHNGEITPLIDELQPATPASESTPMPEMLETPEPQEAPDVSEAENAAREERQAQAEEAAALQLIKDHKVEMKDHAVLQPLVGQDGELHNAPAIIHTNQKPLDAPGSAAAGLSEASKFALTPPSMGSALNSTEAGEDSPMDAPGQSLAENKLVDGPLLTHSAPAASVHGSSSSSDIPQPKPAQNDTKLDSKPQTEEHLIDMPTPAAAPAPGPKPSPALIPQYKPEAAAASPLIAPVFDTPAPSAASAVTAGLSLADLEKKMGSSHAGPTASTESVDSGAKPMDMPAPAASAPPAPPPLPVAAATPAAAAPPPVPPPMMPPAPRAN